MKASDNSDIVLLYSTLVRMANVRNLEKVELFAIYGGSHVSFACVERLLI